MIPFRGLVLIIVVAGRFCGSAWSGQQAVTSPRAISVTDVFAFRDLHDPQISPEGQWVAYTMGTVNREEDKNQERIWMEPAGGRRSNTTNGEGCFVVASPVGIEALQERPSPTIKPVSSPNAPKNQNSPTGLDGPAVTAETSRQSIACDGDGIER